NCSFFNNGWYLILINITKNSSYAIILVISTCMQKIKCQSICGYQLRSTCLLIFIIKHTTYIIGSEALYKNGNITRIIALNFLEINKIFRSFYIHKIIKSLLISNTVPYIIGILSLFNIINKTKFLKR